MVAKWIDAKVLKEGEKIKVYKVYEELIAEVGNDDGNH